MTALKKTVLEFSNICTACGKTRRKEDIIYDKESLNPYCYNIMMCNEAHPNSYGNVAARGTLKEVIPYKEAQAIYAEQIVNELTEEEKEIIKLADKPTSFRVGDYDLAAYLVKVRNDNGYANISDVIRDMIMFHKAMVDTQNQLYMTPEEIEPDNDVEEDQPDTQPDPVINEEIESEEEDDVF